MKRLRILTGKHVGAHLDLTPGVHTIGASHECDIAITDWTFAQLQLVVDGDAVSCRWRQGGKSGGAESDKGGKPETERNLLLQSLEPREFEGIVLCVGPADEKWPSDVQLLSTVFAPTPKRVAVWAKRSFPRRFMPVGIAAAVLIAAVAVWPLLDPGPPPVAAPTLEETRAMMQRGLDQIAGNRLQATIENRTIFVTGMAEDHAQAMASRAVMNSKRGAYAAVARFSIAADIAETIRGTTGLTNPTVRHTGGGVFSVVADVTDERAARAALDRMAADLAPAVKSITASFEKIYAKDPLGPLLSHSQQEGLSIVQTRDGVKHLVMEASGLPPEVPASAPAETPRSPPMVRTSELTTANATSTKGLTP